MKITWLGHSGFRIEIGDQKLLIDPWLYNNPMFPSQRVDEAIADASCVLISHAHADHALDAINISKKNKIVIAGIYDYVSYLEKMEGIEGIGFNRGGTIKLGNVDVTMVAASHSSSFYHNDTLTYGGTEVGFMIKHENRTIYFSGDTDIMSDMSWFGEYHNPEIGILSAGGHFTMDMRAAAYASKKYFNFHTVIPCHYKTFPVLEQSAELLISELKNVRVIEPTVLKPIML